MSVSQKSHYSFFVFSQLVSRCPPPPSLTNATADNWMATDGSSIMYTCIPGYETDIGSSNLSIVCDGSKWEPNISDCQGKHYKLKHAS